MKILVLVGLLLQLVTHTCFAGSQEGGSHTGNRIYDQTTTPAELKSAVQAKMIQTFCQPNRVSIEVANNTVVEIQDAIGLHRGSELPQSEARVGYDKMNGFFDTVYLPVHSFAMHNLYGDFLDVDLQQSACKSAALTQQLEI